jgi:hypothetical protein
MRSHGNSSGSTPMIGKVRDMKILADHFGGEGKSLRRAKILPQTADECLRGG